MMFVGGVQIQEVGLGIGVRLVVVWVVGSDALRCLRGG